jgi:uncharacterized protein YodC (DUF2158 family)
MEKRRKRKRLTKAGGFRMIVDYLASGMSCAGYYKRHGISSWRFYWWRRRYELEHPELQSPVNRVVLADISNHQTFCPVEVSGSPVLPVVPLPAIEIKYPSGISVCIAAGLQDVASIEGLIKR